MAVHSAAFTPAFSAKESVQMAEMANFGISQQNPLAEFNTPTFNGSLVGSQGIHNPSQKRRNIFNVPEHTRGQRSTHHNQHATQIVKDHIRCLQEVQQQMQRPRLHVSQVGVPRTGRLQLNAGVHSADSHHPRYNHLPHTAAPGDQSTVWGQNRVHALLQSSQVNIFTPIQNRNYLTVNQQKEPQGLGSYQPFRKINSSSTGTLRNANNNETGRSRQDDTTVMIQNLQTSQDQGESTKLQEQMTQIRQEPPSELKKPKGVSKSGTEHDQNSNREQIPLAMSVRSGTTFGPIPEELAHIPQGGKSRDHYVRMALSKVVSAKISPSNHRETIFRRSSSMDARLTESNKIESAQREQEQIVGRQKDFADELLDAQQEYLVEEPRSNQNFKKANQVGSELNSPTIGQIKGQRQQNIDSSARPSSFMQSQPRAPLHAILAHTKKNSLAMSQKLALMPLNDNRLTMTARPTDAALLLSANATKFTATERLYKHHLNHSSLYQYHQQPPSLATNLLERTLNRQPHSGSLSKLTEHQQLKMTLSPPLQTHLKSRQDNNGLLNPVAKMTPGHQLMLLHSSKPSQGQSSALFYGKPGQKDSNQNYYNNLTNTNQTGREDCESEGPIMGTIPPQTVQTGSIPSPHTQESHKMRAQSIGASTEVLIGGTESDCIIGEPKYSIQGLFEESKDTAVATGATFVKISKKLGGAQLITKRGKRAKTKKKTVIKRGNQELNSTAQISSNPVSIHNMIRNRTQRHLVKQRQSLEAEAQQVVSKQTSIGSVPQELALTELESVQQAIHTAILSKCASTECLPSSKRVKETTQILQVFKEGEGEPVSTLVSMESPGVDRGRQPLNLTENDVQVAALPPHRPADSRSDEANHLYYTQKSQSASKSNVRNSPKGDNPALPDFNMRLKTDSIVNSSSIEYHTAAETARETARVSIKEHASSSCSGRKPNLDNRDINIVVDKLLKPASLATSSQISPLKVAVSEEELQVEIVPDRVSSLISKKESMHHCRSMAEVLAPPEQIMDQEFDHTQQAVKTENSFVQDPRHIDHLALKPSSFLEKMAAANLSSRAKGIGERGNASQLSRAADYLEFMAQTQKSFLKAKPRAIMLQSIQKRVQGDNTLSRQADMPKKQNSICSIRNLGRISSVLARSASAAKINLQKQLDQGINPKTLHLRAQQMTGFVETDPSPVRSQMHKSILKLGKAKGTGNKKLGSQKSDLEDDFLETMDEVTMKRAMKIEQGLKRDDRRIKEHQKVHVSTLIGSLNGHVKQVGFSPRREMPAQMNEYVHKQMMQSPTAGRLTRSTGNPYQNVKFHPDYSSQQKVQINTQDSIRNVFESTVGIANFDKEATGPSLQRQDSDQKLIRLQNAGSSRAYSTERTDTGQSLNEPMSTQTSRVQKTQMSVIRDKSGKKLRTTMIQSQQDRIDESKAKSSTGFNKMPLVKPINLREIANQGITEILLREQHSCQHYSLVSTPKALRQGAKFNIEREEKIVTKRLEIADAFQRQRAQTRDQKQKMWLEVKQEYCQDFDAEKLQKKKERLKEVLTRFRKNFLEHFEILRYKMRILPENISGHWLFPSEPFQLGDVVRLFLKHVKMGNLLDVFKLLREDHLLPFQYDEMQQNGLIWAAKRNHTLMVRMLLKAHSRPNWRDIPGRTALHFAVINNNEEMVRILLCFKADPNLEDNKGQSAMALYKSMAKQNPKQLNLKIGAHLRLASSQIFRQKYIVDFIYTTTLAVQTQKEEQKKAQPKRRRNSSSDSSESETEEVESEGKDPAAKKLGWTRRELKEREWVKEVVNVLDPYKEIQEDELKYI